jgi:hypothetical protein
MMTRRGAGGGGPVRTAVAVADEGGGCADTASATGAADGADGAGGGGAAATGAGAATGSTLATSGLTTDAGGATTAGASTATGFATTAGAAAATGAGGVGKVAADTDCAGEEGGGAEGGATRVSPSDGVAVGCTGGLAITGPLGGFDAIAGTDGGGATTMRGSCLGWGTIRRGAGGAA